MKADIGEGLANLAQQRTATQSRMEERLVRATGESSRSSEDRGVTEVPPYLWGYLPRPPVAA